TLCRHYKTIITEEITIGETIEKNHEYYDAVRDARWDLVTDAIRKKCRETGRTFVEVKPFFTSQDCSRCQSRQKVPLGERMYRCGSCGLELDRDTNAALNIKRKGIAKLARQREAYLRQRDVPF